MKEVDWSSLNKILRDSTRRSVLELLAEKEALSYTEIMALLQVTNTGRLNYHLKALGDLLSKDDQGRYRLTERGQIAANLLKKFPEKTSAEKKPQSTAKIVVAAVLLLVGILLIASAALLLVSAPFAYSINTEQSSSTTNVAIPQKTTMFIASWPVTSNSSATSIEWSASSSVSIYMLNMTQYDNLLLQHSTNGEIPTFLDNFTGNPPTYLNEYNSQIDKVSTNLPQGRYYFFAESNTPAIIDSFTMSQQQAAKASSSESSTIIVVSLIPLVIGITTATVAILILKRRIWQ